MILSTFACLSSFRIIWFLLLTEDDLSVESLEQNFITSLRIPDGMQAVEIEDELLEAKREQFRYSLVERFLTDRPFNLRIAKQTILKT